jgi:hypothetical protein
VRVSTIVGLSAEAIMSTKVFVVGPHSVSTALISLLGKTFDDQRTVLRAAPLATLWLIVVETFVVSQRLGDHTRLISLLM